MIKKLIFVSLMALQIATAQTRQTATDYIANRVDLTLLDAPTPVQSASVFVSGNPGPATYYYWIVTQGIAGASVPSGPFQITNAPNTLTGSNFNAVSWTLLPTAVSYDVLRTTTPAAPTGNCNCAVVTANTSGSVNDQSNSLSAYTVSTLNPSQLTYSLTNESVSAGVSQFAVRANGSLLFAVKSNGQVMLTLPSTVVQTNQTNTYTTGTQDFSATTLLKARLGAGLTTSTNGDFGYDTTSKNWHFFDNGADSINVVTPSAPTNGDCTSWSNAAGTITASDAGAPCVTTTGTQTITGKTLSGDTLSGTTTNSGTISGGTVSGATISGSTVGASGLGGLTPSFQQFTSNGTFTIPSGVTALKVTVVGGGGAGGGGTATLSGGGGGAGGVSIKLLSGLTPGNTLAVTVGTGGGPVSGAAGNAGTGSSVSSGTQTITTISTNPGSGGTTSSPGAGGAGAAGGSGGDFNFGGSGGTGSTSPASLGGPGAGSIFGGGGTAPNASPGVAGSAPGAGGGGAGSNGTTNNSGGAGKAGIVIFEWTQ